MKIELGKFYIRRDGKIAGPIVKNRIKNINGDPNPNFPFLDEINRVSYSPNGRALLNTETQSDLIREFNGPLEYGVTGIQPRSKSKNKPKRFYMANRKIEEGEMLSLTDFEKAFTLYEEVKK